MTTDTLTPRKTLKPKPVASAHKPEITRAASKQTVSEEIRRCMIAEAAYFRALARNFSGGSEQEDWLLAEREIDQRLASQSTH